MRIIPLSEITITEEECVDLSTHDVQQCVYKNKKCYLKFMSTGLSPQASLERLVIELIATHVAHKIGAKANLAVPEIQLVFDSDKKRYGLLTSAVGLENIEEFGSTKQNLIQALQVKAFAYVVALRFFLKDPDGHCNMGYQDSDSSPKSCPAFFRQDVLKFSAIDFGLARYDYLEGNGLLLSGEEGKFNTAVFKIDSGNIYKGIWQPDADGLQCSSPLAAFPGYDRYYKEFDQITVIKPFNANMRSCYQQLTELIDNSQFKSQLIEELGLEELMKDAKSKEIIYSNIAFLKDRATSLKTVLDQEVTKTNGTTVQQEEGGCLSPSC